MDKAWRVVLVLIAFAILFLVAAAVTWGERAGDTIECYGVFRDSSGVATRPATARFFVFKGGTNNNASVVDSSAELTTTITWYHRVLHARYTIPAVAPDSTEYFFAFKASGPGVTDDWFAAVPSRVTIGPGSVDSLYASSVVDLWTAIQDSSFAVIDSSDAGGIYNTSDEALTNASVFISTESNLTGIVAFGYSSYGDYHIVVPLDPVNADTLYISAWYQNSWVKSPTQFIVAQ